MIIEEKVREIMVSEELPDSEKLDRLHALIPPDACKIDNLSQATPAQLRQLKDGLMVTDAMEKIRCADFLAKEADPKKGQETETMNRRRGEDCQASTVTKRNNRSSP
jgi:hypothetical protein